MPAIILGAKAKKRQSFVPISQEVYSAKLNGHSWKHKCSGFYKRSFLICQFFFVEKSRQKFYELMMRFKLSSTTTDDIDHRVSARLVVPDVTPNVIHIHPNVKTAFEFFFKKAGSGFLKTCLHVFKKRGSGFSKTCLHVF